jgi:hypothetical protein
MASVPRAGFVSQGLDQIGYHPECPIESAAGGEAARVFRVRTLKCLARVRGARKVAVKILKI